MPTAIRPGKRRAASRTKSGSRTAAVPRMTRRTPRVQPALDRPHVADAAAELHRHASTRARIASTAAAFIGRPAKAPSRSTTCSQAKPCALEIAGLRGRVVVEDGGLRHVALHQADAVAVLQVDRGKQDHGRHLRKLAMRASPSFWLFSGWNCVPATLSRADHGGDRPAIVGGAPRRAPDRSAARW